MKHHKGTVAMTATAATAAAFILLGGAIIAPPSAAMASQPTSSTNSAVTVSDPGTLAKLRQDPNGTISTQNQLYQTATQQSATLATQQKLDDLGTWIQSQPGVNASGYLAQVDDSDTGSVQLLWHGKDNLLTKVKQYAQSQGIAVTVVPRSYNAAQAQSAVNKIEANSGQLAAQGFAVSDVVGISADSDSITINGTYTGNLATPASGASSSVLSSVLGKRQSLATSLASSAGTPVSLAAGTVASAVATRSNDFSPF